MRSIVNVFLTVATLCAILSGCRGKPDDASQQTQGGPALVEVQVASVRRGDVAQTLELVGNFLPRRRTIIVTEVDGVIKSIPRSKEKIEIEVNGRYYSEQLSLDLGQKVNKGDVLLQIDPRDYELECAASEAALEKAKKDLAALMAWRRPEEIQVLRADRDEASARLSLAKSELNRVQLLRAKNAATESEYDQRQADFTSAMAVLDGAEAELSIATNGPTQPEIDVAKAKVAQADADVKIKNDDRDRTTIRAPYDAVITDRYVDEGDRVTALPRVEIMEIMDLSLVVVQVGIPERHIHKVRIRDLVSVNAEGVTDPVPGIVVLVNDKIDTNSRTYRVRVAVDNRAGKFKAGQFVRVGFVFNSASDSLTVPKQAVTYSGGQPQVFVYADDEVLRRNVKLGLSSGKQAEILDGLAEDEQVVVHDPGILSDGMPVRLKRTDAVARESGVRR